MITALRSIANAKAVGRDELPVDLLKLGLTHDSAVLWEFHPVWHQRKVPQRWRDAVINALYKKKDSTECGNYRVISLLAHAGKVLIKIVGIRLSACCEAKELLPKEQCGFFPCRPLAEDMMRAVRRLQELGRKTRVPLFLCFIALQRACDTVDRTLSWQVLARFRVQSHIIEAIRQFHDGMKACLQNDDIRCSEWCEVAKGLPSEMRALRAAVQRLLRFDTSRRTR